MLSYALSRREVTLRNIISLFVHIPVLFNGGLVPTYILLTRTLKLKNTIWVLIVVYLVSAIHVLIMRIFFKSIPGSLIESARNDWMETTSTYSFFANEPLMWDMEPVGDMTTPGWVRFTEPAKVMNQFETLEFAEYCDIMREWHLKGYVRKDGATLKDHAPDRQAAKIIAAVYYGWPDTLDSEAAGISTEGTAMSMCTPDVAPAVTVSTTRTVIPAEAGSTAAVAISAGSNHIEKSLELIELLNINDELYLLITNGEEGTDYEFDEDGNVKYIEGKYFFNYYEWTIAQSYSPNFTRVLYAKNETGEALKKSLGVVFKADKEADVSPVSGFIFDPTPVKT